MIGKWLKKKVEQSASKKAEKDILRVISEIQAMTDHEVGTLVATATMLRISLRENGVLSDELFNTLNPKESFEFGQVMNALGDLIRKFQSEEKLDFAAGIMVWHQSLRAIGYPEIRSHGITMWDEIRRGFPYAESGWKNLSALSNDSLGNFPVLEIPFIPKLLNRDVS